MRFIGAVSIVLAGLVAAFVASPAEAAPKAAKSKAAKSAPVGGAVRAAYAAIPEADRIAIQADLIWTGD